MSIQAGWNSALGIVAGIDYLKKIRKGQQEQIARTKKPYTQPEATITEQIGYDDVADMRRKMKEQGEEATSLLEMSQTPGMEPDEKEMVFQGTEKDKFDQAVEAQLNRLEKKELEPYEAYGNDMYRMASRDLSQIKEGALKGYSPSVIKRQQQMRNWDAAMSAQEAAKEADSAPKNTMQGAKDYLRKIRSNTQYIGNKYTGGEK